jgi:hypothetical protein
VTQLSACIAETNPRREEQLLLCCARTSMDSERAERITDLLKREIDWVYVIQIALPHRVMPLLYRSLQAVCPEAVPKIVLEKLRLYFYANNALNLFLTKKLLKLLRMFEAYEIPAIPYKGPVLAASVYGNLALRQFSDLDILVHERDYRRAQHLLVLHEYRLTTEYDWESTFVDGSGRVAVDLHKEMTERDFPSPLDFEWLSARLQPIVLSGAEVPNLSPEDTLLMLAVQITKDVGGSNFYLAKICDVAELLRVYPGLDWTQTLKQAKGLGCLRMLLYSLGLANNLLGAALPQEIVAEMRFHPAIVEFVTHARGQLFDGGDRTVADQPTVEQFRWLVRERLRDKLYPYYLRYVTGVIVPCDPDRRLLRLPERLSFLYYFIRPIRLLGKYGSRLLALAVLSGSTKTASTDAAVSKQSNHP